MTLQNSADNFSGSPCSCYLAAVADTSDESQIGPNKHEARMSGGNDGINPHEHDKKYMGDDVLAAVDVLTTYSASRSHDDSTTRRGLWASRRVGSSAAMSDGAFSFSSLGQGKGKEEIIVSP